MTINEKLNRIAVYESLGLSQSEMEMRLRKDESCKNDDIWKLIRDEKFKPISEFDAWDDTTLEDYLLSGLNEEKRSVGNIVPGDILVVRSFYNIDQDKDINNTTHRLIVLTDSGENNIQKRTFFGHAMSSNLGMSNKYNKNKPHHIFIDDYDSILQNGQKSGHKPAYVNLNDVAEIKYGDIIANVGHITPQFNSFLLDTKKKIRNKEDTSKTFWES